MEDHDDDLMVGDDIVLHGFVGDTWMGEGFTPRAVLKALAGKGDVTVRLNSGGGYATDGAAIHAMLRAHPGEVTVRVEGIAASAASLIAMAGDRIVMAPGALLMIHDPAALTMGTADDHRKSATDLDKLAATYARVYAARSGKDEDEVRALMVAETWMNGAEAVAMGFATEADDDAPEAAVAAFDFSIYAKAPDHLRAVAQARGWRFQPDQPAGVPATSRKKEAVMAAKKEAAVEPTAGVPAAQPTMTVEDATAKAVAAERERVLAIRQAAAKMRLGDEIADRFIADGTPLAAAHAAMIDAMADRGDQHEYRKPAEARAVDAGGIAPDVDAMIGALHASMFGGPVEGRATQYRGMTLKKLAMHLAGNRGYSWNDADLVKAGMSARGVLMAGAAHGTTDFAFITAELMNRQLRAAYNSRPGTWGRISRVRPASDFRTLYSVRSGVDTEMRKVQEDGEYESTVIGDEGEAFRVERYGRKVLLSFEAVINDDLGAFARLPGDFARGARNLESRICWGLINANGNMSDGTAFFATARKNRPSSGGAISADTVAAARRAMWEQRPFGADPKGSDFIEAEPDLLFVPPALEIVAMRFVADTVPTKDEDGNPYKSTLTPVVEPRLGEAVTGGSDKAWYLFDSRLPVMEHAFLAGYEAPMVETMDRLDPDGVTMIARHIFGAGLVEPIGAWKNPGP